MLGDAGVNVGVLAVNLGKKLTKEAVIHLGDGFLLKYLGLKLRREAIIHFPQVHDVLMNA